jgi:hypothetical protein
MTQVAVPGKTLDARKARVSGLFLENNSLEALKSRQELNERLAQRAINDENLDLLLHDSFLLREGLDKISGFLYDPLPLIKLCQGAGILEHNRVPRKANPDILSS